MKTRHSSWHRLRRESVRTMQAAKLRRWLRDVVVPFHPHYRELLAEQNLRWNDIHTLDDLARFPFTTKADLSGSRERTRAFVITPDSHHLARRPSAIFHALTHGRKRTRRKFEEEFRPIFMTSTTGRSSDPVPFLYTDYDMERLKVAGRRMMEIAGAKSTDRLVSMFPFAPHLAFWQAHYAAAESGIFMLSSGGGKTMGTDGNLRLLRRLEPDVIIGMPTFLYHVLHEAMLDGVRCENLSCLVLGGEKAPEGMRRKLREIAAALGAQNVSVVSTYGFTEAKMAWCECRAPAGQETSGYHLYPDLGIVEIVDPASGKPVADGQPGEIVFTGIDARGSCVLRYRTGDLSEGGLTYEPCPHCGRRMPRLTGRISRASEVREMQLDKIKGVLVDFNELEHVLDDLPGIGTWQIELCKAHNDPLEVDELLLHIAAAEGAKESDLKNEISSRLFERAELRPNRIEFHTASEIRTLQGVGEALKERKLVDRRPARTSAKPTPKS